MLLIFGCKQIIFKWNLKTQNLYYQKLLFLNKSAQSQDAIFHGYKYKQGVKDMEI